MILLYIPWIAICPEFTNTKISNSHELLQPSSPLRLVIPKMTLKPPTSSSPICSSKSLKFCNCGKPPYIVSSYCQYPHVNFFNRLFTWRSQSKLTRHVSVKIPTNNFLGVFQVQPPISVVNFSSNTSVPHKTWHNLWNFLTINFKDEFFHNSA